MRLLSHFAGQSYRIEDVYPRRHLTDKFRRNGFINSNHVLFFVVISRTQDLIHDIAIIGQKNQAIRRLI
ncbi:Uncharacterised protein [Vibrio cholerae]|nr:Uncharacterised protein [Vibrio cholerae]CSI42776.1 Uncharacterised protein [Vibrio cholerae]